jgi:Co/Zn/Cd efflux system component
MIRAYIGITGLIFALMFAAHVARVWVEGTGVLRDPIIILTTILSLGLAVWAVVLLSGRPR